MKNLKDQKMHVWLEAWKSVAGSSNCNDVKVPAKWANQCLNDFEERFPDVKVNEGDDNG